MRATTKGVSRLAVEAGLPDSMVERHIDSLVALVLMAAKRERKLCKQAVRAWYFDKNMGKMPLFEVLEDIEEDLI